PNPEAKATCADGTALDRVWESRTPPEHPFPKAPNTVGGLRRIREAEAPTGNAALASCYAILDCFSKKIGGRTCSTIAGNVLIDNAVDMAMAERTTSAGLIVYADHGTQFTSCAFGENLRRHRILRRSDRGPVSRGSTGRIRC
ncbi:hypothetical protein IU449_28250, partial [Nocardia higoensis]|nr:hypothetical protein [Nocardia higoensis]